ncbi:MAG: tRNA 2-selenouridine(34) synthase MnmH [Bacteroidetes bacterium]|nr:tRNA 2-selenouridine(34) synthase MnmH [Bacteroidota bacterium]
MPTSIDIEQFLILSREYPILDVRTPAEFEKGNIPGAHNLPLFTNEERAIVGTIYKQQGRQPALLKGLELVGPKMKELVLKVETIINQDTTSIASSMEFVPTMEGERAGVRSILMHCWRGGMRSSSVAWLLELYGYKVYTLKGGYKFFRRYVLATLDGNRKYIILGGRTGSGKTLVLKKLAEQSEQVVDLEKLAHHKGSSFGSIGEEKQPTQEQFENCLAIELKRFDPLKHIWLEDESRLIGKKVIPAGMWEQMRAAKVAYIDIPFNIRAEYLTKEYGQFTKKELAEAITRITKRLGGLQAKQALEALEANDLKTTCEICLAYYDKTYDHGLQQRETATVKKYIFEKIDADFIASEIKQVK